MDDYYFLIPQFVYVYNMGKETPIVDQIEDNKTDVAFRDNQEEQGAVHAFSLDKYTCKVCTSYHSTEFLVSSRLVQIRI